MDQPTEMGIPTTPFTLREAKQNGLRPSRLRRRDLVNVSKSIYRPVDWDFDLISAARVLSEATPDAWVSHSTAARIHTMILPPWLAESNELHLSKVQKLPPTRRKGISGHTVLAFADEVATINGIRMSTKARTWLDLAAAVGLHDLVAMGDQLIRIPRAVFEGRDTPHTTLTELKTMVSRHRNLQGIVRAREALDLMRVGSDSGPETMLRLAMYDAGLPEPDLQVKLYDRDDSASADLGYKELKIALQYDGAHHLDDAQRWSDRRRDKQFTQAGWTALVFNRNDLDNGFDEAIRRIKKAIRAGVVSPPQAAGFI